MTTTDPTAPATPAQALRREADQLETRYEMAGIADRLRSLADELDAADATDPAALPTWANSYQQGWNDAHKLRADPAPATPPEHQPGARTYELPAQPPGPLWDPFGVEWEREDDVWYDTERRARPRSWPELLMRGRLSTTPPAGTDPASTAVDLPAGMQP